MAVTSYHFPENIGSVLSFVTHAAVGETIRTYVPDWNCWHYGIADGVGGVIHASKRRGGVVYTAWEEFSERKLVYKCLDITSDNLPAACEKAKTFIGQPYTAR